MSEGRGSGAPLRAGIVGARRVRQGLGPFVARDLSACGVEVHMVLGTTEDTARAAADQVGEQLARDFTVQCLGPPALAARKAARLHWAQRSENGQWTQLFVETPTAAGGAAARAHPGAALR